MTPTSSVKRRVNVPKEENPTFMQMSTTFSSVSRSSLRARRNRCAARYAIGATPTVALNSRARWNRL